MAPVAVITTASGATTLIARFMGPTWGPSGADRTQVGPMWASWTFLSGQCRKAGIMTTVGFQCLWVHWRWCFVYHIWSTTSILPSPNPYNSPHPLPRQNGRHFAEDNFTCIFMNEKFCISIQISLKFLPKGAINNKAAFVQVMACRRTAILGALTKTPSGGGDMEIQKACLIYNVVTFSVCLHHN